MNDFYEAGEQDRHVELVAIQPGGHDWPPAARAGLGWALQHALESMSSEEQIEWSSSAIETRVTIKPYARFERGDGKICRNFVQIWVGKRVRHNYPGTACREAAGRWQVPGLADSPEKARALLGGRS
jgi:surface antigen